MQGVTTIGLDIAKSVFQVHGVFLSTAYLTSGMHISGLAGLHDRTRARHVRF